ncbi:type II toxin-antitoxin system VapC family toxin [soil metagenome]|nr:type II toxin-antitoxin system VapC family toxin [Acidobacteriota bacterium]
MIEWVLVDTNIFVEIFRNKDAILQKLIDSFDETCINTIIYLELVRGELNKKRYAEMEDYLSQYKLLHLTPTICQMSLELMRQFRLTNGLDFPDALIAATCLEHNLFLYTKNQKHFKFIPNLKII